MNGFDTGQTVSYSAVSSNPNVSVQVLPSSNPIIEMTVSGTTAGGQSFAGEMTFELFANIAPQTVAGIVNLVNNGTYNGAEFYRSETGTGFQLIQGGIEPPTGLIGGKTAAPVLPDEFNVAASFNSPGLLAMANAGPGTASSEFFVMSPTVPLDQEPQELNFGYTIFGQLLTGQTIYQDIEDVPTTPQNGIDYDNTPVTINSASVITSTDQAAVLQVSEPSTFTGSSNITVTAKGSDNTSAQQSFTVDAAPPTVAAKTGGLEILGPVANQTTIEGKSVSFQVSATDGLSGTPVFTVTGDSTFTGAASDVTVQVTPGSSGTATVTLTPAAGFTGTLNLVAHADDTTNQDNFPIHDALPFTLTVTAAPQISVTGDSQSISDGATTSSTVNATAFGNTALGTSTSETFTIANSGSAALTVGSVSATGDFKVTSQPSTSVAANGSTTFTVQFTPTASGTQSGTISFSENDTTTTSPFTFAVSGVGTVPLIKVTGGGNAISDGSTTTATANDTNFGNAPLGGTPVSETFTIANSGTAPLTVGNVSIGGTNSSDFKVTSQPASSVAAGGSTTFTVQFTPTAGGTRNATISFSENDTTTSSPFTFAVTGFATTAARIGVTGGSPSQAIDDGSTTPSSANGTSFGTTLVGSPVSQTYTISNSGTAALTVENVSITGAGASNFRLSASRPARWRLAAPRRLRSSSIRMPRALSRQLSASRRATRRRPAPSPSASTVSVPRRSSR